jgi:hypothetical protein
VQQQQRLHSCSLVCHAWHRAAAAATTSISFVGTPTAQAAASFLAWLEKHGSNVTSIDVTGADRGYFRSLACVLPSLLFPCQQLQQLSLKEAQLLLPTTSCQASAAAAAAAGTTAAPGSKDLCIQEGESSSSSSSSQHSDSKASMQQQHLSVGALSSLTSLRLRTCTVTSLTASDGLACLSTQSQLRRLQLHDITEESVSLAARTAPCWRAADKQAAEQFSIALGTLLATLCQLTHLSIEQRSLKAAALQGLSNMQQLRELRLSPGSVYPGDALQALCKTLVQGMPQGLQCLELNFDCTDALPSSYLSRVSRLTGLLHLELPGIDLQGGAGIIAALTQLTHLQLTSR